MISTISGLFRVKRVRLLINRVRYTWGGNHELGQIRNPHAVPIFPAHFLIDLSDPFFYGKDLFPRFLATDILHN